MSDREHQPICLGSGFVVAQNLIVTNNHVIKGADSGVVKFVGSDAVYKITKIESVDEDADLAAVRVEAPDVSPLPLAGDEPPPLGEEIYVIGAPKGFEGTFSKGNVSALRKVDNSHFLLQITAPISHGSSGGPVLNSSGEVVAVTVSTSEEGQNLNFAVPVRFVRQLFGN